MNFVLSGRGRYLLGDRRYDLHRHSMVWLFSRQEHVLLETTPDFACYIAVFRPRLIRRVCEKEDARLLGHPNPPGRFCRQLEEQAGRDFATLCRLSMAASALPRRYAAALAFLLLEAWAAFQAASDRLQGTHLHPSVERAAAMLRDREGAIELEELAAEAGLSLSRLSRLFKTQLGIGLVACRNQVRLRKFLDLYDGRERNALHAALAAGFGSYAQFHRIFKKAMGTSPAGYRRGKLL
jgi:AraC-like DNA-binding protein